MKRFALAIPGLLVCGALSAAVSPITTNLDSTVGKTIFSVVKSRNVGTRDEKGWALGYKGAVLNFAEVEATNIYRAMKPSDGGKVDTAGTLSYSNAGTSNPDTLTSGAGSGFFCIQHTINRRDGNGSISTPSFSTTIQGSGCTFYTSSSCSVTASSYIMGPGIGGVAVYTTNSCSAGSAKVTDNSGTNTAYSSLTF